MIDEELINGIRCAIREAFGETGKINEEDIEKIINLWDSERGIDCRAAGVIHFKRSVRYNVKKMIAVAASVFASSCYEDSIGSAILASIAAVSSSLGMPFVSRLSADEVCIISVLLQQNDYGILTERLLKQFSAIRRGLRPSIIEERFDKALEKLIELEVVVLDDGRVSLVEIVLGR